ncbi:hypothetical protein WJX73_003490 [Symbiochloris irregularis]|uniref:BTB domain-containing protein n=1 Tax=Symbiochloris irregularis TaxID=706552 RepID=A0AAW1NNH0_9CHLO
MGPGPNIITLNVGGNKFCTSRNTLEREPGSMLGRMFSGEFANNTDSKGRVFVDRDPKHFGLILNYLRDGTCVLPADSQGLQEILQEADFYQLEGLKAFVGADARWRPHSAQLLQHCITSQLQANAQLKAVVALLLQCAFGRAIYDLSGRTPPRQGRVTVALRESAFNPLSPQQHLQNRDETLYVGFEQRISFQGCMHTEEFEGKHETNFIHDDAPSYDPAVYSGTYPARFHIKTTQVYEHHCLHQLPASAQRLRAAAMYIANQEDAVRWGLEICGFKGVALEFAQRPFSREEISFQGPSPMMCHMHCHIRFSL